MQHCYSALIALSLVCSQAAQANPPQAANAAGKPRSVASVASATPSYGRRADVLIAAQRYALDHELDAAWVADTLAQARFVPAVAQLIMPAPSLEGRNWAAYRSRFVAPRRVEAGRAWWRDNHQWLQRAEQRYGVPAEIVVGIIGVETFYGRVTGSFRVLDALATLAFDFPTGRSDRSGFFRSELGHYLQLARREGWDPAAMKGSYAGAMGLPQFMPSSVTRFAVDFDEDGRIDLHANTADVIGSVASFLAAHGWARDMPTHFAIEPPADTLDRARLLVPDILPSFSATQLGELGAQLGEGASQHVGALALVELHNGPSQPSYVAGTQNFYALTRYNASSYYAMAVIELGRAVSVSLTTPGP